MNVLTDHPEHLRFDRLHLETLLTSRTAFRDVRMPQSRLRRIPLSNSDRFVRRAQAYYDKAVFDKLTELRSDMQYRRRQLVSQGGELEVCLMDDLEHFVSRLVAHDADGHERAHAFLRSMRHDLQSERNALAHRRMEAEVSAEIESSSVQQSATWLTQASAISAGFAPFSSLLLTLSFMLVTIISSILMLTTSLSLSPTISGLTILAILFLSTLVLLRTVRAIRLARETLVAAYNARLNRFRQAALLDVLIELYDDLIYWTKAM